MKYSMHNNAMYTESSDRAREVGLNLTGDSVNPIQRSTQTFDVVRPVCGHFVQYICANHVCLRTHHIFTFRIPFGMREPLHHAKGKRPSPLISDLDMGFVRWAKCEERSRFLLKIGSFTKFASGKLRN